MHSSGESAHWKGEYSAKYNDSKEDTKYFFSFKNAKKDTLFKDFAVDINGKEYKGEYNKGTYKVSTSCSGVSGACRDPENEPIKVSINWDDKYKETFFLKPDK
ncbi:hypothetical protein D9X91_13575 [Falsibacillus albus]|uniref:Uncharacterized protein n=2 Tax=Falsibacillus albus TaxID=2478915 RepID=A0A3L7JW72_9BACI|nr:hypothetical protein D9X91_13575 [Falsibacillus albus]